MSSSSSLMNYLDLFLFSYSSSRSDGHLGAVQHGCRTARRLVDLLCGPELPEPSKLGSGQHIISGSDKTAVLAELFLAHSHYEAYLNLLRLSGGSDGLARPACQTEQPTKPLSLEHIISLSARLSTLSKTDQIADWCLLIDLQLQVCVYIYTPFQMSDHRHSICSQFTFTANYQFVEHVPLPGNLHTINHGLLLS